MLVTFNIPKNFTGIIEYPNGSKAWYVNGNYHRTDGPAVEYFDGTKFWCLNGKSYSEKEWKKVKKLNHDKFPK